MQSSASLHIEFNPVRHYWSGRGGYQPIAIVEGMMQGTIEETWRYFSGPADDGNEYMISAHYGVARDGRIWQFVKDEDTAWSNGILKSPDLSIGWINELIEEKVNCNQVTLSIEYEGFSGEPLTPEQYAAALELHAQLIRKWQIEVDAEHIIGRNVVDSVDNADNPGPAFPLMDFLHDLLHREAAGEFQPDVPTEIQALGFADEIFAIPDGANVTVEQAAEVAPPEEVEAVLQPIDDVITPPPPLVPEQVVSAPVPDPSLQPAFIAEALPSEEVIAPLAEIAAEPVENKRGKTSDFLRFISEEEERESEEIAVPSFEESFSEVVPNFLETDSPPLANEPQLAALPDFLAEPEPVRQPKPAQNFDFSANLLDLPSEPAFEVAANLPDLPSEPAFEVAANLPDLPSEPAFELPDFLATPEIPAAPEIPHKPETFAGFSLNESEVAQEAPPTFDFLSDVPDFAREKSEVGKEPAATFAPLPDFLNESSATPANFSLDNLPDLPSEISAPAESLPELPDFAAFAQPETFSASKEPQQAAEAAEKEAASLPDWLAAEPGTPVEFAPNFDFLPELPVTPAAEIAAKNPESVELPDFLNESSTPQAVEATQDFAPLDFLLDNEPAIENKAEPEVAPLDFLLDAEPAIESPTKPAAASLDFLLDAEPAQESKTEPEISSLDFSFAPEPTQENRIEPQVAPLDFLLDAEPAKEIKTGQEVAPLDFLLDAEPEPKTPPARIENPEPLLDFLLDTNPEAALETAEPETPAVDLSDLLELPPTLAAAATPAEPEVLADLDFFSPATPPETDFRSALGGYEPQVAQEAIHDKPLETENSPLLESHLPPEVAGLPVFLEDLPAEIAPATAAPLFEAGEPLVPDFEGAIYNPAALAELEPDAPTFVPIAETLAPEVPEVKVAAQPTASLPSLNELKIDEPATENEPVAALPDWLVGDLAPAESAAPAPEVAPGLDLTPAEPEAASLPPVELNLAEPEAANPLLNDPELSFYREFIETGQTPQLESEDSSESAAESFNYPFELPTTPAPENRSAYAFEFEASSPLEEYRQTWRGNEQSVSQPPKVEKPVEIAPPVAQEPATPPTDFLAKLYQVEDFAPAAKAPEAEPVFAKQIENRPEVEKPTNFDKLYIETPDTAPTVSSAAPSASENLLGFELAELEADLFPLLAPEPEKPAPSVAPKTTPTAEPEKNEPVLDYLPPEIPVPINPDLVLDIPQEPLAAEPPAFAPPAGQVEFKNEPLFEPQENFATVFEFEPKPAPAEPDLSTHFAPATAFPVEPPAELSQAPKPAPSFEPSYAPTKSSENESPLAFFFEESEFEELAPSAILPESETPPAPDYRLAAIGRGVIAVELANLRADTAFDASVLREAEEGEALHFDGWRDGPELRGSSHWLHFTDGGGGWVHSALIRLDQPFEFKK